MSMKSGSFELSPMPGLAVAFRQQVLLLAASRRWAGVTLSILLVMVLIDLHNRAPIPGVLTLGVIMLLVSAIWAIVIWSGEGPSQRSYHWSLPVPRAAHELARVAAGAFYLVAMCVVFAAADAILSSVGGHSTAFAAIDGSAWANYFVAPLVVYFLAMPLVLWRDYRVVRWLMGIVVVVGLLTPVLETLHIHFLSRAWQTLFFQPHVGLGLIINGMLSAMAAAAGDRSLGPAEPWLTAALVWLGIGLLLTVLTATYRPGDIMRKFSRPPGEQ